MEKKQLDEMPLHYAVNHTLMLNGYAPDLVLQPETPFIKLSQIQTPWQFSAVLFLVGQV
jgi:hypothetical protein